MARKKTISTQQEEEKINKDVPKNNTDLVVAKLTNELEILREQKAQALLVQGKTQTYVKDRVYKFRKEWWDKWHTMLNSEDSSERKTALIEYNKLQARILPTQLVGQGGQQVQVNIIGMGVENPEERPEDNSVIDGDVIN